MTHVRSKRNDFLKLLREDILKLNLADLDFGIYRILNYRRGAVETFLNETLPARIEAVLNEQAGQRQSALQHEVGELRERLEATAKGVGLSSAFSDDELNDALKAFPIGQEYLKKAEALVKAEAEARFSDSEEERLYNTLYTFFSRYYEDGDFLPQPRRGKEARFSVDYQGEDVHFSWRGRGSHYVKSGEQLRTYAFKIDGTDIRFQFVSADLARDNTKGDKRYLVPLHEPNISTESITISFEFRPLNADEAKLYPRPNEAQEKLIDDALELLYPRLHKTVSRLERGTLERHLRRYARKNLTDYFVHPNLGTFLKGEFDYYLKNEYLDVGSFTSPEALTDRFVKFRALQEVGYDIISFLDQIESFQARLFEKRRFVLQTDYLVPARLLNDELKTQAAENEAQVAAWRELLALSGEVNKETFETHPTLVIDTQHFDTAFKQQVLALFDDLDDVTDGVLVHSENYGALRTLEPKYGGKVKVIYIDPPYNTGGDGFLYKDDFSKHSTWLTMMEERLKLGLRSLSKSGVLFASIDDNERVNLERLLLDTFSSENRVEELVWAQNTTDNTAPTYSTNHEYVEVFARDRSVVEKDVSMFREPKPGYLEMAELVEGLNPEYPPVRNIEEAIDELMKEHLEEFKQELREQGLEYDSETKKLDPWRGIYPYSRAEYRDSQGKLVSKDEARANGARIWVWQSGDASAPSGKQAENTHDPDSHNYRFYRPLHPITRQPCPHPGRGWMCPYETSDARISFKELNDNNRIIYGKDESNVPRLKRFLQDVETNVSKSVVHDYTDGEKELTALMGSTNTFPNPKPTTLIERLLLQTSTGDDFVVDYFAGSGTTVQALLKANRSDGWKRRFVLIEMGEYFDSVLLPRVLKTWYSPTWKDGEPREEPSFEGMFENYPDWVERSPRLVKVLRLESFEDSLNALELPQEQSARAKGLQEIFGKDYLLKYLLPTEVEDTSKVFLNTERLERPFDYKLRIHTPEGPKEQPVDLIETFNLLMGYHVKRMFGLAGERAYTCVEAQSDEGSVLVLWRDLGGLDPAAERAFLEGALEVSKYAKIYVNGDSALPGAESLDAEFKKRLLARAVGILA